jgi:hypothetical protein
MQKQDKLTSDLSSKKKITWITPKVVSLNVSRIIQQMNQQELDFLNLLANDENAFRLLTGSFG